LKDGDAGGDFEGKEPGDRVEGTNGGVRLFGAGEMIDSTNDVTGLEKEDKYKYKDKDKYKDEEAGRQHRPIDDARPRTDTHNQQTAVEDSHQDQHNPGTTQPHHKLLPPPPLPAHHKTPPPGSATGHVAAAGRALAGGRRRSSLAKPQAKHLLQPPPSPSDLQAAGAPKNRSEVTGRSGGVGDGPRNWIDPVTAPRPVDEREKLREYRTSNVSVRPIPKASSKYRAIDTGNCSAR
jgi:hypothetical protein